MIDIIADAPWFLPIAGFAVGILLGAAARWSDFCTLTALERYWYANDATGVRTWVLAAAVALASTQLLIILQLMDITESFYLNPRLSLLGGIIGGVLFGVGMALVGTCSFGALVRLGSGSLRSLIIVIIVGLSALFTQRGWLSQWRTSIIEPQAFELNAISQSLPSLLQSAAGFDSRVLLTILISGALFSWIFSSADYRGKLPHILTGVVVGLCITSGWVITSKLSEVMYRQVQIESASFVLPPGELINNLTSATASAADYGIGLLLGVVFGAFFIAALKRQIHWEACDDARELGRHLVGSTLMGIGGVLAAGCTIGQGVSAFSTMAISAPIVVLSICIGARMGLRMLFEGLPFMHRA